MFKKVKEKLKGVKRFMGEKIQMMKDILSSDKNKLTTGYILIGGGLGIGITIASIGAALVKSVYTRIPASINQ